MASCVICGLNLALEGTDPPVCLTCRLFHQPEVAAAKRAVEGAERAARLGEYVRQRTVIASAGLEQPTARGEGEAHTLPKSGGLLLPDYREALPRAYRAFMADHGKRPTQAELAARLMVSEDTVKRRIADIRALGDPWPPLLPPSDH